MTDHITNLRIDLSGNLSPEAKAMGEAMLRAAEDAKKLDTVLEQSGASKKMQDRLKALGASAVHVDAVVAALKAYKSAEDKIASGGDWTRDQINGFKSLQATTTAVVRARISEEKSALEQIRRLREDEVREARRVADVEIAESRRSAEARERAMAREVADQRRHNERMVQQHHDAQHRMGFAHYVAGGVVAGASAHGVMSGIEAVTEAGAERQKVMIGQRKAGMSKEEILATDKAAGISARDVGNLTKTRLMEITKEIRSAVAHPEEATKILPEIAKLASAMQAAGMAPDVSPIVKAGESLGLMNDPKRFRAFVEGQMKAMAVDGRTISPEQIYEAAKYSKSAGATLSDDFLNNVMPSLIQELHGSSAGDALSAVSKRLNGGLAHQHLAVTQFKKMGLLAEPSKIVKAKGSGEIMGYTGKVVGAEMLASDPERWFTEVFKPAAVKMGVKTAAEMNMVLQQTLGSTGANLGRIFITQAGPIAQHRENYKNAPGLDESIKLQREDATVAVATLKAALDDLGAAVSEPAMAPIALGLNKLSDVLRMVADAAASHPDLALGAGVVAGGAALYGAGRMGMAAMNGFGGGAAAAEQGVAAKTQITAAEMQMEAAGKAAATAAAKGITGGAPGGSPGFGNLMPGALAFAFQAFTLAQNAPEQLKRAETDNAPAEPETAMAAGLGDRLRAALGSGPRDGRVKDDAYAPAAPPTSTLSPSSYWAKKNAYLHRSAYIEGEGGGMDDGVERGPIEGQGVDSRMMLAVSAGTEAGVLAAFARMKTDGSATSLGPNGLVNVSLGGGDFGGMSGGGGGGGGRAPSIRYGRQHSSAPFAAAGGGADGAAVHDSLKDLIAQHETGTTGAGGYDTAYGHAERGGRFAPPKPISQMTIAEVLAYQRKMKSLAGSPAFPVGRAQWTETTLRGLTRGMDPNTVFSPEVQEKLFDRSIAGRMGQGVGGFRSEWDSLRGVSPGAIQAAIAGHRAGGAFSGGGGGSAGSGDAVSIAGGLLGAGSGQASKALHHVMTAGLWCADFVNGTIEAAGGRGSGSSAASSFANWGKAVALADAKRGDVILENSGRGTRVHHAGLVESVDHDAQGRVTGIHMISGNYGHKVSRNLESMGIIAGLRRGDEPGWAVRPRTHPAVPAGPRTSAGLDGPVGIFDHDNIHGAIHGVRQLRRELASLGDSSVSVISGPRGATRGKARADVGRKLRGAPASTGTAIA